MSLDSSKASSPAPPEGNDDGGMEAEEGTAAAALESGDKAGRKKASFKDKIKVARVAVEDAEARGKSKLSGKPKGKGSAGSKNHVLGGTDYLKQFESRPGGFKKKLR